MSANLSVSNFHHSDTTGSPYMNLINLFVREGEKLLDSAKKCEDLWDEMCRTDFRGEGILNEKNITLLYERKKSIVDTLFNINSLDEFLEIFYEVFDNDMDGCINQDEQILIFSVIKERITILAEKLCSFQKYELYKDLMKEVRLIEAYINKFQNILRKNVHLKQLNDYISIGKEQQDEFTRGWRKIIDDYNLNANQNKNKVENENKERLSQFLSGLMNQAETKKVKIPHTLKMLEVQEKLVAINERVEEATNFRNELKKLKKVNDDRFKKEKEEEVENLKKHLIKEFELNIKKEENRIKLGEDKLKINWNRKSDIQNKRINLHINDIIRIQNSLNNLYTDIGSKADEMKRTKERQRNTNKALHCSKQMKDMAIIIGNDIKQNLAFALLNIPTKNFNLSTSSVDGVTKTSIQKKSILALKFIVNNLKLVRFDINNDFSSRKFCNIEDDHNKNDNNLKKKIKKILDQRKLKDEIVIPPSFFYDDHLNLTTDAKNFKSLLPNILNK